MGQHVAVDRQVEERLHQVVLLLMEGEIDQEKAFGFDFDAGRQLWHKGFGAYEVNQGQLEAFKSLLEGEGHVPADEGKAPRDAERLGHFGEGDAQGAVDEAPVERLRKKAEDLRRARVRHRVAHDGGEAELKHRRLR